MADLRIRSARMAGILAALGALLAVAGCTMLPTPTGETRTTAADGPDPTGVSPTAALEPEPRPFPAADPWARHGPAALVALPDPGDTLSEPPQPEASNDLLERVRAGFALPAAADASITRERDWFAAHPEYLDRVFKRAESYLYFIVAAIEEREMPLDIALLPIVESAFDPFAYSHGRASGLWQIIPGTGRRLGLKQNWWFDGRRDIPESTRAALDYLELLHEQFDGDWLLAIAGYNSGEGNVARAVRRARAAGRPIDFWNIRRDLPAETRTYVPRLIAIRDLVADPSAHSIELPEIADESVFAAVDTDSQIDMALAAELAGLDVETLYQFNPGINRWATDPDGPHRLLLPLDAAPRLEAALAGLNERDRVRWTRHRISNGETLSQIALRYDTTADVLREINGIRGNTIRAGQFMMIPHAAKSADTYSQSIDARTDRQRSKSRAGTRIVHTVRSGESFWTISRRYGVGVRELAAWNAMAPGDTLPVGRELTVWADNAQPTARSGPAAAPQIRRINYVVRRGDSLAAIAQRFRVTVANLVQWNSIDPGRYLQPGQRLVMHVDVTEQSS